jgi:DNA invertase Pin-like site-specific DNA recombinase
MPAFLLTLRDSGVKFAAVDLPEANDVTVGIMALVAQQEREAISKRTKEALAVEKARGVKLGNPNDAPQRRVGPVRGGTPQLPSAAAVRGAAVTTFKESCSAAQSAETITHQPQCASAAPKNRLRTLRRGRITDFTVPQETISRANDKTRLPPGKDTAAPAPTVKLLCTRLPQG